MMLDAARKPAPLLIWILKFSFDWAGQNWEDDMRLCFKSFNGRRWNFVDVIPAPSERRYAALGLDRSTRPSKAGDRAANAMLLRCYTTI